MMKQALLLAAASAAALGTACGSLTMEPLAGGSGAGNPGNAVVILAMRATGSPEQVLGKASSGAAAGSALLDSAITVADRGGLLFTLTSVSVSHVAARFMLDSSVGVEELLSRMDQRPPELASDTNSIVFTGSHEFDAVRGRLDSLSPALRLPVAEYTGVAIDFVDYGGGGMPGMPVMDCSRISMEGTFIYKGDLHTILIAINYAPDPTRRCFPFGGGIFTLSAGDTTNLELLFDATSWFSNIDFAAALGSGSLRFNPDGVLDISSAAFNPCVWGIQAVIAGDFFASGRLLVY